jgi:hypothetical protein
MPLKSKKDILGLLEAYKDIEIETPTEFEGESGFAPDRGPEAAEGLELELPELEKEKDVDDEKNKRKTGKLAKENINTFTNDFNMKNNNDNIFDKLYQSLMENEDLPSMDEDPFASDDEIDTGDDLGLGDEGDTLTVELPREVAEKLHEALGALLDVDPDSEIEDLDSDNGDAFGDDDGGNPFEDSIEVVADPKPLADTNLKSGNNSNKNNKVKASGYSGKGSKATSGKIPDVVADPKDLPDTNLKSGNNSNMGSNKVQSPGTNQGELIK